MSPTSRITLLILMATVAAASASAQVTTGTPPLGSFGGGPDVINLANLDLPPSSAHEIIRHQNLLNS